MTVGEFAVRIWELGEIRTNGAAADYSDFALLRWRRHQNGVLGRWRTITR